MCRTTEKRTMLIESYLASSSCIHLHTISIEFSCASTQIRSNVFFYFISIYINIVEFQRFHACVLALSHWNNFKNTIRMYPTITLFTSRSQHKIFWQVSSVDIIPESSSSFEDLIILERDVWYWACNFSDSMQLIILFELFTKCLQNCCAQFWRVRVQQRGLHLRINPVSLPNFLRIVFKVARQRYFDSPTVCEETRCFRTYSLDSDRIF